MLRSSEIKKILCDNSVVALATTIERLAREGAFADATLDRLSALDQEYCRRALEIATGVERSTAAD